MANNTSLTGASGEFYVAHFLTREEYIVSLPPQKSPLLDMLVSDKDCNKFAGIQVKTAKWAERERGRGNNRKLDRVEFDLGHRPAQTNFKEPKGMKIFYVFVDLWGSGEVLDMPKCYIATLQEIKDYCGDWAAVTSRVRWHIGIEDANNNYYNQWDKIKNHLNS